MTSDRSSTPIDDEVMALPYAEVIAQDRLERWEAGARIASTTTVTGDEYKLAKAYLDLLSKQSESGLSEGSDLRHDMAAILQTACDADEADPRELLHEIASIASRHPWPSKPRTTGVQSATAPMIERLMEAKMAESPVFLPLAIELLNIVKAWRDCDGNYGFPHEIREKIDALLMAYELREQEKRRATKNVSDRHLDKNVPSTNILKNDSGGQPKLGSRVKRGPTRREK